MKKIQIILIGLVAIIGIVVAVILIDPFNWHIRDRFGGEYDAALTAIPADSLAYVGVNLLNYDVEQWDTYDGEAEDGGVIQAIDDAFFAETGLHVEDDVMSWLGQYAGVAILSSATDNRDPLRDAEWLGVAEVRDVVEAAVFLSHLEAGWAERHDTIAQDKGEITYFDGLAFARMDRLVLVGSSLAAVEQGVAAIGGDSLADDADYAAAIAALPAKRLLTGYLPVSTLALATLDFPDGFMGVTAGDVLPAAMGSTAVSLNSRDDGIQIDSATVYNKADMSRAERIALSALGDSNAAAILPANVMAYAVGQPIAISWPPVRQQLVTAIGEADFEESMQLFGDDFGLNPDTGLLPLLTGGTAVALLDGIVPVAVLESEEMDEVKTAVSQFNTTTNESGLGDIEEVDGVYNFTTFLMPDLAFSYALTDEALLFSSDSTVLAALPATNTLADAPRFQEAQAAFPDMNPDLYLNVPALLRAFEVDADGLPFVPMIAGGTAVSGNIIHHRLIIFIDQNAE